MVKVDDFANEVIGMMKAYTDEVQEAINKNTQETAEYGCQKLKNTLQPSETTNGTANRSSRRLWKKYASSWSVATRQGTNFYNCRIHNKKYYQLTHLLEYGHATRDGKTTRGFAHIKPVEEEVNKILLEDTKNIIKKGGSLL